MVHRTLRYYNNFGADTWTDTVPQQMQTAYAKKRIHLNCTYCIYITVYTVCTYKVHIGCLSNCHIQHTRLHNATINSMYPTTLCSIKYSCVPF